MNGAVTEMRAGIIKTEHQDGLPLPRIDGGRPKSPAGQTKRTELNRQIFTTSRELEYFSESELTTQTGYPKEQWWPVDNLRRRLDSAALASAITSELWQDRLLGKSEDIRSPVRAVWLATGNNPTLFVRDGAKDRSDPSRSAMRSTVAPRRFPSSGPPDMDGRTTERDCLGGTGSSSVLPCRRQATARPVAQSRHV